MKKYLNMYFKSSFYTALMAVFLTALSLQSNAQSSRYDKIEELKIAFISKQLNLSPKQSQDFWPIYNEYDHAKQGLFRKYRKMFEADKLSMQDVEQRMEREKEFIDLKNKYINRFSKVLTPIQIADLKSAERQFKKLLLSRSDR